jgi:protein gp37
LEEEEPATYDESLGRAVALLREAVEDFGKVPKEAWTLADLKRVIDLTKQAGLDAHAVKVDNLTNLGEYLRRAEGNDGESPRLPHEDTRQKYVTLEAWDAMSSDERRNLLAPPASTDRFNDQGTSTGIKWALWSWNPVTGCLHNCPYCYARDIAERFYEQKFAPALWPDRLRAPANMPDPDPEKGLGHKNVFVCSMADLFGRWVPGEWIDAVLAAVRAAPLWNFLFLTKFPVRMAEFDFPDNAWVGTTVDCQARVANAERSFRKVRAGVKWLSLEPLLEPLRFADLGAFDWVVIGGASRSSQTPAWHPPRKWIEAIEEEAIRVGVPYFEKANNLVESYPGDPPHRWTTMAPKALRYLPTPEPHATAGDGADGRGEDDAAPTR